MHGPEERANASLLLMFPVLCIIFIIIHLFNVGRGKDFYNKKYLHSSRYATQ